MTGRTRDDRSGVRPLSPLTDFFSTETGGAAVLAAAALVALVWANSPWSASYFSFWGSDIGITVAGHTLELSLQQWVNEGLMTIFFLVVGLEIKRELTSGHLANRRAALLPLFGALGGMLIPAALFFAIAGRSEPRAWAIVVATDIALALGIIALASSRVPTELRAFLLGLAIIDDIGAIIIIAAVYTSGVAWSWVLLAVGVLGLVIVLRALRVYATWLYVVLGVVLWFGLHEAGIHPTLAGVALGLLAPSVPRVQPQYVDVDELIDLGSVEAARASAEIARSSVSIVEWLQHVLHPWTSYVIVPLFALANVGVSLNASDIRAAATSVLGWGIVIGLVIGKPLGIGLAVGLGSALQVTSKPARVTYRQMLGVNAAAGIGFTVALFIAELALSDPAGQSIAKIAILVAFVISSALSLGLLLVPGRPRATPLDASTPA